MKALALILISLLFSLTASSYSGNSLTWQKLALEEKVQRKFNNSLSSVLKDNQYMVEVEVEVSDPGSPNFGSDNNKTGPKVSDLNMEESRGDYIAFSKMGLEVPVVEKFLDEDRTKLVNLYRFNETYDLFKNIAAVKVTIYLSDKIPAPLLDIVKNLINNSKVAISGVKPNVKYEMIGMEWVDPALEKKAKADPNGEQNSKKEIAKEEKEPKIWAKDWFEWASRWGNAFGLILGSLILGIMALMLFKQWKAFMEAFKAVTNDKVEEKDSEDAMALQGENMSQEASHPEEDDVASTHGFERFKQCLIQHPEEAITLIRAWINDGENLSIMSLKAVAHQASREEMELLLNGLSEYQRDKWKALLGDQLDPSEIKTANSHIFQEVVKSLLVPSKIKDGELLNLMMELTPDSARKFMEEFTDQIGVMMNVLGPSFISKILSHLDDQTVEYWLTEGTNFQASSMNEQLQNLKVSLMRYKEANAPTPFAQRLADMIPVAAPAREGTLYRALAKAAGSQSVLDVAKKHFPTELVMNLPTPFLKEVMQSYPLAKRVELIYSRPEEIRNMLIDSIAEAGTPARDMIDMEIENVSRDAGRQSSIESRAEEIWHDFVKLTRNTLTKSPAYTNVAEQLIVEWSKTLSQGLTSIKGGKAA